MISDRLERLVEEMVDRGVQFDDAVREFEKRFIARVLGRCDGSLTKTADALRHAPQHADPQDGRVQDQATSGLAVERADRRTRWQSPLDTANRCTYN